jgi:hypothetical protein
MRSAGRLPKTCRGYLFSRWSATLAMFCSRTKAESSERSGDFPLTRRLLASDHLADPGVVKTDGLADSAKPRWGSLSRSEGRGRGAVRREPAPHPPVERLSQEQMVQRASLHRTEIGLLESGKRVCRVDTLIQLAGAVAIPHEEFIEGIIWVPSPETQGAFTFNSRPFSQRRS